MIDDVSMVPLAPTTAGRIVDEEAGVAHEAVVSTQAAQHEAEGDDSHIIGEAPATGAAAATTDEVIVATESPPSPPPPPPTTREAPEPSDKTNMAFDPPIELDVEGGHREDIREEEEEDDDDDDYDDDDISVPPPPPPPMPPSMQGVGVVVVGSSSGSETIGSKSTNSKKTTKIAILAIVSILVCAGIGLGLGFGLTSGGGSSSSQNANYSNPVDSGSNSESESDGDGEVTSTATTSSTDATIWSTDSTISSIDVNVGDGSTTTTSATSTTTAGEIQMYDAVIIGAGWAGIRATEILLTEGINSILVLEANDYIGGRARSFNGMDGSTNNPDTIGSVNIPYDLGADWMYDNGNEMVTALTEGGYLDAVSSGNVDDDATTTSSVLLSTAQFYKVTNTDGGTMSAEVVEESDQWMEDVWNGFITFRENNLQDLAGLSYQEAIDQYIEQFSWTDDESLQLLNAIEDTMEYEYTADSSQLDISEIEYYPPGFSINTHYMGLPGFGFGNLAAQYAESTTVQEKVLLNAKVVEINSSQVDSIGFTTVTYETNDGTNGVIVQAKTVLVTVSLGVLKANKINFIPSLPDSKLESISNMGFGTVNKCMMSWNNDEDLVWPEDEYWFLLLTPEDDGTQQQEKKYSPWTTFFNPSKFKGKPSLTAWLGGKEAIYAEENQTDDEILVDVMTNLRAMFPTIRDPDRVLITRWGQDPTSMGAYSYPVPGRDFYDDAAKLSEVYDNVYFAGEATGNGWATTQGAWRTGEAAALSMAERIKGR